MKMNNKRKEKIKKWTEYSSLNFENGVITIIIVSLRLF